MWPKNVLLKECLISSVEMGPSNTKTGIFHALFPSPKVL